MLNSNFLLLILIPGNSFSTVCLRYSTPGGYSAKAVHPIALAKVMNIAQMMKSEFGHKDYSLSAIGGVETGGDAAEFILLGANTVQVGLESDLFLSVCDYTNWGKISLA